MDSPRILLARCERLPLGVGFTRDCLCSFASCENVMVAGEMTAPQRERTIDAGTTSVGPLFPLVGVGKGSASRAVAVYDLGDSLGPAMRANQSRVVVIDVTISPAAQVRFVTVFVALAPFSAWQAWDAQFLEGLNFPFLHPTIRKKNSGGKAGRELGCLDGKQLQRP
ncbi:hypothetical protein VTK73DRAFT_4298 [Phialemonium thermophilum]|uniref:Uncharacterized protein n=1 Tax=Phialemonium thermophilum TaxID=223376 RepID=A0ABR3V9N2_9PEZI